MAMVVKKKKTSIHDNSASWAQRVLFSYLRLIVRCCLALATVLCDCGGPVGSESPLDKADGVVVGGDKS